MPAGRIALDSRYGKVDTGLRPVRGWASGGGGGGGRGFALRMPDAAGYTDSAPFAEEPTRRVCGSDDWALGRGGGVASSMGQQLRLAAHRAARESMPRGVTPFPRPATGMHGMHSMHVRSLQPPSTPSSRSQLLGTSDSAATLATPLRGTSRGASRGASRSSGRVGSLHGGGARPATTPTFAGAPALSLSRACLTPVGRVHGCGPARPSAHWPASGSLAAGGAESIVLETPRDAVL